MARILVIDDDRIIRTIVTKSLTALGYEVIAAADGLEGLRLIKAENPDAVVTDKLMPGMDGFEVTRRLRREPGYAHLPIMVLTSESDLEDRVGAFEAGADDYLSKPFETAELAARLTAMLRKAEALRSADSIGTAVASEDAHLIAVHSLRGGLGSTSLAVNLSISLASLWQSPTLLLDMVLASGQIALMLNSSLKRTWTDLASIQADEMDIDVLKNIMGHHDSRVQFIASPGNPMAAESFNEGLISTAVSILRPRFSYIVADLPHDFSDTSLDVLDTADYVLLLMAPEMASVRTAAIALDTYKKLGYSKDKIKLVLNWIFEHGGLAGKKIETALNHPISLVLPFAPTRFVSAINRGVPLLHSHPEDPVAGLIEDFAFRMSKKAHQGIPPASPSSSWHRVNERLQINGSKVRKKSSFLSR
jgi:pilus assembly protein CpaE